MNLKPCLLWTLQGLFLLRVLGQVYVGLYAPESLPPWREWYSGLLPYPLLLPAQMLLLMWMSVVSYDNTRQSGRFHVESAPVRRRLRWIAALYAGVMALRYVLTMAFAPEMRWVHGTIPIAFHFVLAGYVAALTLRTRSDSAD
jgi:cyanate permease